MRCVGGDVVADCKDARGGFVVGCVLDDFGIEMRISFHVTELDHHLLIVIAIGANEFVAECIERLAELGGAGGGFEFVEVRTEAEVCAFGEDFGMLWELDGADLGLSQAGGEIDPVVDVERWMTDAQVGLSRGPESL